MKMTDQEIKIMMKSILDNVHAILEKNKKEISKAYLQTMDMGGLPISVGIKLQGDSTQIKSIVNLSFMMEKFKTSLKETIELKQMPLDLEKDKKKK